MRPKKLIVDVDPDGRCQGMRALVLAVRGYRVATASTAGEALELLDWMQHAHTGLPNCMDLLLVEFALEGSLELIRDAVQMHPSLPVLLVSRDVANHAKAAEAGAFLPTDGRGNRELLEQIGWRVARKRGPKSVQAVSGYLEKLRA